ncbi:hypothetical protein VCHA53O466_40324 [Vibrio chagasii]|nr:hypothetical protein VCHA53O466_40324 [Vibrio chagasii]
MILSKFLLLLLGTPLPLNSPLRQELNEYKHSFMYDEQYKLCAQGTQLQLFDEPFKCTRADYITFYVSKIFGEEFDISIKLADAIHPERTITTNDFTLKSLSNREGELFYMSLSLPYESITKPEVTDAIRYLRRSMGSPDVIGRGFDINYQWITTDGFDVKIKEGVTGYILEMIDREGYDALNRYIALQSQDATLKSN